MAAHTAAQESQSAGRKTKQAREEGNASNQEQQRYSCPSADNFCWVWARHWTPSCVCYMSQALLKARGCRRGHRGHTLMRRVRGGQVGGESEMRYGQGQTIMRSIKGDIQTKEYRDYRDYRDYLY